MLLTEQPNEACSWRCLHTFCMFRPTCILCLVPFLITGTGTGCSLHFPFSHAHTDTHTHTHTYTTHTPHTHAHIRLAVNRLGRITKHKSRSASFIEGLSDLELSCAVGKAEEGHYTACAGCETCEIFHWGINHSHMPWIQSGNFSLHNQ